MLKHSHFARIKDQSSEFIDSVAISHSEEEQDYSATLLSWFFDSVDGNLDLDIVQALHSRSKAPLSLPISKMHRHQRDPLVLSTSTVVISLFTLHVI